MLNTPSNLYSGAAQVFNDMPHVAFQTRLLQQHAAKQDALDQYYRKMPLTINEKGVRDQERPIIAKSMLEIKDYYIKNKDKLKKGDDAAAFNYEKMVRNHQDLVGRSQQAGLTDTQVGKFKFTPALQYMFQSPETVQKLAAHHLPIDDPNHIDFDLEEFTAPPKPLVKDTYMKRYDKLKFNEEITTTMNKDGTETVTKTPKPSEETLNFIMSNATQDYLHDQGVTIEIDKFPTDNTNPYNSVFKKHWGRDIENPIDATAAFILANKIPQPKTETIDRTLQRFAHSEKMAAIQNRNALGRLYTAAGLREDAENEDEVLSVNAVLNNIKDKIVEGEKITKAGSKSGISGIYGGNQNIIPIADAGAIKLFANVKKIGTTTYPADNITFDKTKKQFNLNYSPMTMADGSVLPASSIPISERDYVTEKVKEIYGGKNIAKVNKIVDEILTNKGGLYNTLTEIYAPSTTPTKPTTTTPAKQQPTTTKKKYNPKTRKFE